MTPLKVVFGFLGTTLDAGQNSTRWERWRPTVCLGQQQDLVFDRLELLYPRPYSRLAHGVAKDFVHVSPTTKVQLHSLTHKDPWDFEEVYTSLHDFAGNYPFQLDREEYYLHITTGTHVAQICLFLLAEARRFPARLVQTSPVHNTRDPAGECRIIDLDLSKYDSIAARFETEFKENVTGLKSGIKTLNAAFNQLIEELEHVAAHAIDPILLTGPTGAGKSQLARRIFELKKHRRQVEGDFVEVNCATLRGDGAMSALFGHKKGSFTGASADRPGLLRAADSGVLFLDELGELGLDEQAMLLRAIEEKRFLPVGADAEVTSRFQLVAGTNRDLWERVRTGHFREDFLARVNMWTFKLPALRDRREDIEPNIDYELNRFSQRTGTTVRFSTEARLDYIAFATSQQASWPGNFRDLSASISRMATLAPSGRITRDGVAAEIARLQHLWNRPSETAAQDLCAQFLGPSVAAEIDPFDRAQLSAVLSVCSQSRSLSEAGRALFSVSRTKKTSVNDADRLRKYLTRFGIDFDQLRT